jgi:hypothetical protein
MLGAAIVALNLSIDLVVRQWMGRWDFTAFSTSRFLIDLAELGLLLALALSANRVWPIFSAATQMVAVAGSLEAKVEIRWPIGRSPRCRFLVNSPRWQSGHCSTCAGRRLSAGIVIGARRTLPHTEALTCSTEERRLNGAARMPNASARPSGLPPPDLLSAAYSTNLGGIRNLHIRTSGISAAEPRPRAASETEPWQAAQGVAPRALVCPCMLRATHAQAAGHPIEDAAILGFGF